MRKILAILLLSAFLLPSANAFEDADRASVNRLLERGVLTDSQFFSPDDKCTKADFVEWSLKNIQEAGDKNASEPFFDVSEKDIFFPFVAEAWELGVLDSAKVFLPQNAITKYEALKIALLLEGVSIPRGNFEKAARFSDLSLDERAIVQKGMEMRIIREKSERIFGADERLTRLDCVKLLDSLSLRRASENLLYQKEIGKNKETILDQIQFLIEHKYFPTEKVDSQEILESGAKGMVNSLDDPYSIYFTPEETNSFLTSVGMGSEYGIGAQVGIDSEGRVIIMKPLRGSPAESAELQAGDVISKIDGEDVLNPPLSLEEVVGKIKGQDGTSVNIEFLRRGTPFLRTIVRAPIVMESVFAFPQDKYLVIEVDFFGEETRDDILAALDTYKENAKNGVIFDLRNNPGGLLQSAIDVLGVLLPTGSVAVKTQGVDVGSTEWTEGEGKYASAPMVVLMNEYSASASEIVAGAVQDYGRAAIIGHQSFGKGTAQDLLPFEDGSALKLTIAEWLTPLGRQINGIGVTPDFFLDAIDDDQKAFEYAQKIISRNQWQTKK